MSENDERPGEGIRPALSAEQWASGGWGEGYVRNPNDPKTLGIDGDFDRHALAALCLHEQPYGFTWDDVTELLGTIDEGENQRWPADGIRRLRSIADRIQALLPPRHP